jgi:Na+/melibiose symporter-like transporter
VKTTVPSEKIFRPADYVKISIFAAALSVLWPSLHSLIIPLRLLAFTPEAQKNTYLGLLTFVGSMIAVFVQPVAGALSDRFGSRWGRRRPFIFVGTLLALLFLPGIGISGSFLFLIIGYCLLQVSTNIAQGPFQAFIPDLVPPRRRGVASSAKSLAEILGGVAFLRLVAYFLDNYTSSGSSVWLWAAIGFPGLLLLAAMIATMLTVKEEPSTSSGEPSALKAMAGAYKIDVKGNPGFVWFLVSRLFILMAMVVLQTFALYLTRSYAGTLVCGGLLGLSAGAFLSTNWALATDLVPAGEEARYLGLTNIATAGAGALARLIGPVIDFFNSRQAELGYSVMLLVCILYFVIGSAAVIPIKLKASQVN